MRIKNIIVTSLFLFSFLIGSTAQATYLLKTNTSTSSTLTTSPTRNTTSTRTTTTSTTSSSLQTSITSDSLSSVSTTSNASSTTGDTLYGYAWSSNVGWISLNNCSNPLNQSTCGNNNYGVIVPNSSGALSGYAWSSNIGWIDFGGVSASWASDGSVTLSGFAQACAAMSSPSTCSGSVNPNGSGSWDGKISMKSNGGAAVSYKVKINADGTASAYHLAWGSNVVGWVDFSLVKLAKNMPTVTLVANPTSINQGSSSTLTWTSSADVVSCTYLNFSPNPQTVNGNMSVSPTSDTTYQITCTNGANSATAEATVTVNTPLCSDGSPKPANGVCPIILPPGGSCVQPINSSCPSGQSFNSDPNVCSCATICTLPKIYDPVTKLCKLKTTYNEN